MICSVENRLVNLIEFFMSLTNKKRSKKNDFFLERTRLSRTPEGDWGSFIGERPLEGRDEGAVVILGGGSEGVSF